MSKIPVFDIGDTLLPSKENINRIVKQTLQEEGFENPPDLPINKYNIYKTSDIDKWLKKNNIDFESTNLKKAYLSWEKDYFNHKNTLNILKRANKQFGPIGFISDNSIEAKKFYQRLFADKKLSYNGFIVSEEVGVKKPNKKIFKAFLDERKESAERFVYFGNYVDRDKAAEKVGMNFIWVKEHHTFNSQHKGKSIDRLTFENIKNAVNSFQ